MASFSEKVRHARSELGLTQAELGEATGVSLRTILDYEKGKKVPRQTTLLRLARALKVSTRFLMDESCNNPVEEIAKDSYIMEARKSYGAKGGREIDALLSESVALFAGGDIPQEEKDRFFDALMTAYVKSKEAAKKTYGRKKED
ncbi:MAG: helix-turn-helix transcriptional regulator [Lachnospiraceae bacterium]|jgi:transcriptional regulator with XRE-family HTH domain|nr:helix-turn-helix transcriptional regulator [Lachnospiraceae bacterium]